MVRKGACKPFVRDFLERLLVAKAEQTFLWIALVLPLLEERQLLLLQDAEKLVNELPVHLESTYRYLLEHIHTNDQPIAARVLRLLVVCGRPLTGDEIGIMLTITPDHRSASLLTTEHLPVGQESVQSLLGALVRVHDRRVELIHQSLKDYLINLSKGNQDALAISFGVDLIRDKILVLRACSLYLTLEDFEQDVCANLETLDDRDTDNTGSTSRYSTSLYELNIFDEPMSRDDFLADESTWAVVVAKYGLFDYAALHWALDFFTCDGTTTAQDNTAAFLLSKAGTPKLTNWFRYFWYKNTIDDPVPTVVDTLMVVSYFGHASSLRYLLDQNNPIDSASLKRALYWAARQGHCACVILLLQQPDCDPQFPTTRSQAPLVAAAQFGRLDCVAILLADPGVKVNTQGDFGRTALSLAVSNNHAETVTALLAHRGIDVNLPDNASETPLHRAVGTASELIIAQLLSDERAEIGRLDKRGRSILSWAAELGATETATLIIKTLRVPVDQKDSAGHTPLSYASQHGHLPVVRKLIETGQADPLGQDEQGRNAHSWAAMHRSSDVLRYLTKNFPKGADAPDLDGWTPMA